VLLRHDPDPQAALAQSVKRLSLRQTRCACAGIGDPVDRLLADLAHAGLVACSPGRFDAAVAEGTGSRAAGFPAKDADESVAMIRKLQSGQYRLYSRKVDPKTGKRRNLGTFKSRAAAEKHEREVQYFKRH
jgi:hypothetical protein